MSGFKKELHHPAHASAPHCLWSPDLPMQVCAVNCRERARATAGHLHVLPWQQSRSRTLSIIQ